MTHLALALVLVSTVMHASWNLLARHQRQEAACMWRALMFIALVGFVPAFASEMLTRSLTPTAWVCVAGSGLCCGLYYLGLTQAYSSSDFTVVYPLVRAVPVLLVGVGDVVFGRPPTPVGWMGMVLVVLGCTLSPLESFRDFALRRYASRTIMLVLVAAAGTVGYSLLDKAAAEVVTPGPATAARYGYVFFLVSAASYGGLLCLFRLHRSGERPLGWRTPIATALLNFGAYWLVLWAYQLARRASYVVAFRQFSIVIGVVIGFVLFKEKGAAVRVTGTLLITAGLLLIGLWGR